MWKLVILIVALWVKKGIPHYFRVPRVVLITRQFVLSTAKDAADVPEGYALGNIAFGEYERDEAECGLTPESLVAGADCETGAVLMPISDVLLSPDYKFHRVTDSFALMKLLTKIKSQYMVPVCLPFESDLETRSVEKISGMYLVDFINGVPRDIMQEEKEITKLSVLPKKKCHIPSQKNVTALDTDKIICTSGCGLHLGAPSIVQERTGHWTLIALSLGGSLCPDPLRSSSPAPPPRHLLVQPYVGWITSAITGKTLKSHEIDDPFGFMPRALEEPKKNLTEEDLFGHDWNGHWWMGGIACFFRGAAAEHLFKFYHEIFQVKPWQEIETNVTYYLQLDAAHASAISCVKVGLPYQFMKPKVWGIDTPQAKVRIPVIAINKMYKFQVEAFAHNITYTTD